MRLPRTKRVVLFGVVLLVVGLAGRAAADTTAPQGRIKAVPAVAAAKSAAKKPKPSAKPKAPVKGGVPVSSHAHRGPGGSKLVTGSKAVALTFDDGPDPQQTPRILKLLAQQHVHATFCLVGENVQRHPDLVRKIVAGGHTLCNHTWNHDLKLGKKPAAKIHADLARTNAAIRKAVPGAKIAYFRAPGGNFTGGVVREAKKLGMASIYWRVDPRDWDHPKGESTAAHRAKVIRSVKRHVSNGAIVLSHDFAQPDTIVAYRTLLPWLRKHYKLIALPD